MNDPPDRTEELCKIRDEVWNFKESPLYAGRVRDRAYPVIGEGNHHAKIMFIGEAPGQTEAKTGRPFAGAAGKLLDELLDSIGIPRPDVYITNVVKDRPPMNRDHSLPEEISLYAPFLDRQIKIIQPKIIVLLGRHSTAAILEKFGLGAMIGPISRLRGTVLDVEAPYGKVALMPMYHPAAALYNPELKQKLCADFQTLKKLV